ncbi:MAG: radical SAM protein [Polyangiaceae bacterium]
MVRRSAVSLGRSCDSACLFCAQRGLEPRTSSDVEVRRSLDEARAGGSAGVTFVGGEPAIDGRLEALVTRARQLGLARVGVQTNGWALGEAGRVEALARAGLTDVHLSIHGAEARVHDWHVGRAGAFEAAMRTWAAARAAALDVVVATVLTRSTFRALTPMPRMLASRGAAGWCIEVPRWRGDAARAADRVVPRLALALPFALHAIDAAEALGLPAFVRGAPSCLLGPWAARALDADRRDYGTACRGCPSRDGCVGVDAEYLARFGEGELAACALTKRDDRHAEVRAMFVGPGEMAPVSAVAVAPSPERARVALPMLGRPAPAKGEVPASSPKQTGEALRAIFPGLFEGEAGGKEGEPTGKP